MVLRGKKQQSLGIDGWLPVHLQMNKICHILRQNTLVGDILVSIYELVT